MRHASLSKRGVSCPCVKNKLPPPLKGRDFLLRVSVNGNDSYRNMEVNMDDGKPVNLLGTLDGRTTELLNTRFDPNDHFKLVS